MSVNFDTLMGLTEAARGYRGGRAYDAMPGLSLTEASAVGVLSVENAVLDMLHEDAAYSGALVEATMTAVRTGSTYRLTSLTESAFDNLKEKISKIFKKIIEFFKSILEKLKVQFNKIRLSGTALYSKYKDTDYIRGKSFKDLSFEGYKFKTGGNLFPAADGFESGNGFDDLVKKAYGTAGDDMVTKFRTPPTDLGNKDAVDTYCKEVTKLMDTLKGTKSTAERQADVAKLLTGVSKLKGSDWLSQLKKELWGAKVNLKYGKDFTLDSIGRLLEEPKDLKEIMSEYDNIISALEEKDREFAEEITDVSDKLQGEIDDSRPVPEGDKVGEQTNTNKGTLISKFGEIKTAHANIITTCTGVINQVKTVKRDYIGAQVKQAHAIFKKMMSWKDKTAQNNSAAIDFVDLEFEI